MSQVAIEKIDEKNRAAASVFDELNTLSEQVRQRAFEIFERRGSDGSAADDWLRAERDLLWIPESELIDRNGEFEVRVRAPGFEPSDVQVMALPNALIVKGSSTHKHDKSENDVRFCEFEQKMLFRRLDLPEPINVDKVTASLENGVLELTALKSSHEAAQGQRSIAA